MEELTEAKGYSDFTKSPTDNPALRMIVRKVPFGTVLAKCIGTVSARPSDFQYIVRWAALLAPFFKSRLLQSANNIAGAGGR